MTFKVTDKEHGEWAVLRVSGELDLVTSPVLRQRVHDVVAEGRHSLVLDLSEVWFCDSSGVGVLIASRRLRRSCGSRHAPAAGHRCRGKINSSSSKPCCTAVSSMTVPEARVRRKASSSAYATAEIRPKSASSSG